MNKKQIIYAVIMLLMIAFILLSYQVEPISADYVFDTNKMTFVLISKLIFPCLLGSSAACFFAQWIKPESLMFLKNNKKLGYSLIAALAAYLVFMLIPVIAMYTASGVSLTVFNYVIFASEYWYLYLIIYFIFTIGIIKAYEK